MTQADVGKSTHPPPSQESLIGRVLQGKYRPTRILASGGMGRVYLAEQLPLGRTVALKVLHSQLLIGNESLSQAESFKKRFLLEASILSKLQHSNIVTVFDYGLLDEVDETYFMVMEFLGGITLAERLRSLPDLSVLEVIQIAEQIARGLREAHRQGVVHRDLKPANVMLVPEDEGIGKIKILDFGLVKLIESEQSIEITGAGEMLGSPKYMSPEQVTGAVKIDQYTDIYSLGVMLYEMLSGRAPFEGDTAMQVVVAVLNHQPTPIADISREALPFELISLVTRCMSRNPESRPASMDQVLSELRACKVALGVDPGATESPSYSGRSVSRTQLQPSSISGSIAGMETIPLSNVGLQNSSRSKQPDLGNEPAKPTRRGLWVGAAVATLAVIVGGRVLVVSSKSEPSSITSGVPVSSVASATTRFVFRVTSSPPGAEVWQDTSLLGVTPLELSLDNAELTKTPRSFVLKLAGHSPLVVQQGPSNETVSLQVNLLPITTADPSSAPSLVASAPAKTSRPGQGNAPAATAKPTAAPTSDIHLTR